MADPVVLLNDEQREFLKRTCDWMEVTEPISAEQMVGDWLRNVDYRMVARVLALESELVDARRTILAFVDDWEWGVRVINLGPVDHLSYREYDEWLGTEAVARRWLNIPRRGPAKMILIRRRPAKPAGLVELVTGESRTEPEIVAKKR